MNRRGFTLIETLVVVVFLVTIFTFIYASIIPLTGKYDDMALRGENIDIVYKLYNIRKMLMNEIDIENITDISYASVKDLDCDSISDREYCINLMDNLDLENYKLVFADGIIGNEDILRSVDSEIGEYIYSYTNENDGVLILLDKNTHTIAHLKYAEKYDTIARPTQQGFCKTDLVYNGTEQVLVNEGIEGFTWSGETGTNAGLYEVKATPIKGYRWDNQKKDTVTIVCEIRKADPILSFSQPVIQTYTSGNATITEMSNVRGNFVNTSLATSKFTIRNETINYSGIDSNTPQNITIDGIAMGSGNINVDFVPDDMVNYNNVSGMVPAQIFGLTSVNNGMCVTGLVYDGEEKTLVGEPDVGYTWTSGITATNAGNQSVTATLLPGYWWNDLSTGVKNVDCSIAQASLSVTATNQSKTFDGSVLSANNNCDVTGTLPANYTVECANSGSQTNAGSSTKTISTVVVRNASGTNVSANFDITKNSGTLTVSKATATAPTLTGVTVTYDGKSHAVSASGGTSGLTIQYAYRTWNGSAYGSWSSWGAIANGTATNAGQWQIKAKAVGNSNYNDSGESNTVVLKVNKATPTVTLAASKPNFTEKASVAGSFANTSSSTTIATVTGTVAVTANTAKTATVTPKYHGSTTITAKFTPTDTTNYNSVTKTVTIVVSASSCSWKDDKDSNGKIKCIIRSSKITGQMASYQCSSTITPTEGDRFFTTVSDGNCNVDGGCKILWASSNTRVKVDSASVILRDCTRSTISSNTSDGSAYTYRLSIYNCSTHSVSSVTIN